MIQTKVAADIHTEIDHVNERFMEAFRKGDARSIAMLYTTDGMVLPPNSDFVEGRDQIQAFWKSMIDLGVKDVDLNTRERVNEGDAVFEIGEATVYGENGQILDKSKYLVVWKYLDGAWQLHRDIFNSSLVR